MFYLCLSGESSFRREFLASLFWESHDTSLARDNLRQVLVRIKKSCATLQNVLTIGRAVLDINKGLVRVDLLDLLEQMEHDPASLRPEDLTFDLENLLAHYQDIGSSFASWVCIFKSYVERKLANGLLGIIKDTSHPEELSYKAALMMRTLDPTDEVSCRFLMQHFATTGRPAEALRTYNELYVTLDENYDVEPTKETIDLNAAIKLGQLEAPVARLVDVQPVPATPPSMPEVFVAGFDIDEASTRTLRLGRFFRAEVLGNLSKFREWNVTDKEPDTSLHYRLDCMIEDHGEDIDAILTLHHAHQNRILWSQRFVVGFENWRQTQWQITLQIAQAIDQTLTMDRLTNSLNERPEERGVFDKWVICANLNAEWAPDATEKMNTLLEEIVETMPRFGLAHAYLAASFNKRHLVYPGLYREEKFVHAALHHGRMAMEIDALDSQSHRVYAWAKALNGEFDVAEFHFQQSYDLNPSNLHVRASAALGFAFMDNSKKACEIADQTLKLTSALHPFHWGYFQNVYYLGGRLQDAKRAGEIADVAISNLPAWQSAILNELGEKDEAVAYREKFLTQTRDRWQGATAPTEDQIFDWFFQCFPLKNAELKNRLAGNLIGNQAFA